LTPPIYAAGEGLRELDLEHLPQANVLDRAENDLPPLAAAADRMKAA
jgi:hypothetical protein